MTKAKPNFYKLAALVLIAVFVCCFGFSKNVIAADVSPYTLGTEAEKQEVNNNTSAEISPVMTAGIIFGGLTVVVIVAVIVRSKKK